MTTQQTHLGINIDQLTKLGGIHTAREIAQQPSLWTTTLNLIKDQEEGLNSFMSRIKSVPNLEVILTGAGTSAFIGESTQGYLSKHLNLPVRTIHSTDLVTSPNDYIGNRPILLVSFARSGNSPESVGAVNVIDQFGQEVYHLIITCNKDGQLVKQSNAENSYVILLPEEANDKSLAMTGSFTSMVLSALCVARHNDLTMFAQTAEKLVSAGQTVIDDFNSSIQKLCEQSFNRAIFLGNGALLGIARESHLKVQELSDGQVVGKFDSFLGFRHGPKAVINEQSLLVFHCSGDPYVLQYEHDLLAEIEERKDGKIRIGIGPVKHEKGAFDLFIDLPNLEGVEDAEQAICSVLVGQILGFHTSIALGYEPDAPSKSGNINRVVQGVTLYPAPQNSVIS